MIKEPYKEDTNVGISEEAAKIRREYFNKYREANKERINEQNRQRYHADKERFKDYQQSYWQRKVEGK